MVILTAEIRTVVPSLYVSQIKRMQHLRLIYV